MIWIIGTLIAWLTLLGWTLLLLGAHRHAPRPQDQHLRLVIPMPLCEDASVSDAS